MRFSYDIAPIGQGTRFSAIVAADIADYLNSGDAYHAQTLLDGRGFSVVRVYPLPARPSGDAIGEIIQSIEESES